MHLSKLWGYQSQLPFCMHRWVEKDAIKPCSILPGFCWISTDQLSTRAPLYAESLHSCGQVQWLMVFSSSSIYIIYTSSGVVLYTVHFLFIGITVSPWLRGELPSLLSSCMLDCGKKNYSVSKKRSKRVLLSMFWGSSHLFSKRPAVWLRTRKMTGEGREWKLPMMDTYKEQQKKNTYMHPYRYT